MSMCIGYGEFEGVCTNQIAQGKSKIFCERCTALREEELIKQREINFKNRSERKILYSEREG